MAPKLEVMGTEADRPLSGGAKGMGTMADERAEAFLWDLICCEQGEDRAVDTAHHRLNTPGWERSAPAGNLLLEAERADSRRWVYRIRRARRTAGCEAGEPNAGTQSSLLRKARLLRRSARPPAERRAPRNDESLPLVSLRAVSQRPRGNLAVFQRAERGRSRANAVGGAA
jgi:hypothetical protein